MSYYLQTLQTTQTTTYQHWVYLPWFKMHHPRYYPNSNPKPVYTDDPDGRE